MSKPRAMKERRGWPFTLAVVLVKPALLAFTRPAWVDGHKIPETGGAVIAPNHISHVDPLTLAHLVYDHGRLPRFLAKDAVVELPVLGRILRATGQIPVHRLTADASQAFRSAVAAVRRGEIVIVHPEGTITRDPDLWPMVAKTGAARIALTAGVPVIPVAQWGAQDVLYPYDTRPHLFPRRTVRAKVGDPVDLDDLRGRPITPDLLREATGRIMDAITVLLEDLRQEKAPAKRFDPREAGVPQIGNPHTHTPPTRSSSHGRRQRRRRSR